MQWDYVLLLPTVAKGFWAGGTAFNLMSFWLTSLGTIATLAGLYFAITQIKQAKSAADEAKEAATQARNQASRITAVIAISDLCTSCRDVISAIRSENYALGSHQALDLRSRMAHVRQSMSDNSHPHLSKWDDLALRITTVHEFLEDKSRGKDDGRTTAEECVKRMSAVLEELSAASAIAASKAASS